MPCRTTALLMRWPVGCLGQLCQRSLDPLGRDIGLVEAQHQSVPKQREARLAINRAASSDFWVERKCGAHHRVESFNRSTRLDPQSRVCERSILAVVALIVLNDDVAVAMHGAIVGTPDDDRVGAMLPVPIALSVIIKRFRPVPAMVEALAILVDDGHAVLIPMITVVMLVSRDDDRVSTSHRRRGQAQRQGAKNDGGFHVQNSEKLRCPSAGKHRCRALVPAAGEPGYLYPDDIIRADTARLQNPYDGN
jgi:hypothetical protein